MESLLHPRNLSNRTLYIIILIGVVFFLYGVIKNSAVRRAAMDILIEEQNTAVFHSLMNKTSYATQAQNDTISGFPTRIVIPKIKVNATVEFVGTAFDGSVGVPKNPDNVGWFQLGARPGEVGSAVITGHRGWMRHRPAVFDRLVDLHVDDQIQIIDDLGKTVTFSVRKIETYDFDARVPEVFASTDGQNHLNLITCTGVWNQLRQSSSKRVVVFTTQI